MYVHAFSCYRNRCSGCGHIYVDQILVKLTIVNATVSPLLSVFWCAGWVSLLLLCANFSFDFFVFFVCFVSEVKRLRHSTTQ